MLYRCVWVLNLVISGIPSILAVKEDKEVLIKRVLNLVISGIPSIQKAKAAHIHSERCKRVLNLVISGIPSIQKARVLKALSIFMVLNLVISGIPSIPLICIRILILW